MQTTKPKKIKLNTIIFGGGIAGLWTLNLLKARGYTNIALLETNTLGHKQTGLSQGIIHGGIKYALANKITDSTTAIQDMPRIWNSYLNQNGEFKLELKQDHNKGQSLILNKYQYLYTPKSLASGFKKFLYQKMLTSSCDVLEQKDYPDFLSSKKFKNTLCKLNEIILDIPNLIQALYNNVLSNCFNYQDITEHNYSKKSNTHNIKIKDRNNQIISIEAKNLILCAGENNKQILDKLNLENPPKMQIRPLHMVWVKDKNLPKLYMHCMQKTDKPLITISSHPNKNNNTWYLGGDIAETGCELSKDAQIKRAQDILSDLFPDLFTKLNLEDNSKWGSIHINRAEGLQPNNKRPAGPVINQSENNIITIWPTKLTFAPMISDKIIAQIVNNLTKDKENKSLKNILEPAKIYQPIWE
jgi:hypothetical protein